MLIRLRCLIELLCGIAVLIPKYELETRNAEVIAHQSLDAFHANLLHKKDKDIGIQY